MPKNTFLSPETPSQHCVTFFENFSQRCGSTANMAAFHLPQGAWNPGQPES
jgi:hypothetical protein